MSKTKKCLMCKEAATSKSLCRKHYFSFYHLNKYHRVEYLEYITNTYAHKVIRNYNTKVSDEKFVEVINGLRKKKAVVSKTQLAKELGISRQALYNKASKLGIEL